MLKIASWNVNSLNVRLPHVLAWCDVASPDILALQETKLTDDRFPTDELLEMGYKSVFSGLQTMPRRLQNSTESRLFIAAVLRYRRVNFF